MSAQANDGQVGLGAAGRLVGVSMASSVLSL
jgi:hypothetical protein